ncbi:zinc finger protein AZF1-like [Juglans microcarpa x Juglans regia]|uniref:zinc finger protein AZF1-like n=1 Tax=Juglans microcarpa x Juglans regia TaxID=2249226 RepID=UPI001B7DFBCE|nr:zinc finger protein AZF1-like [Juglans microcarpa x Juglans regia]
MDSPTNARNLTSRNEKLSSHDEHVPKKINEDKGNEKTTLETAPSNANWKLSREDGDWRPRDYFYRNGAAHEREDLLHLNYSDNSELVSDHDEISGKMMIRKVRKKSRKTMDHSHINKVPVTSNIRSYICSICNKSFPTHQALGGHKSIHNKLMKYRQTMDESHLAANDSATDDIYGHQVDDQTHVLAAGTYRCKICNKTFPTGQAFGGHKRCHVELQSSQLPEEAKAQSSQVTSAGEASQITGRRIFDFDLNDLPAMEVLEEGIDVESVLYVRI